MQKFTIGLDFGTNSCRAIIVDVANGDELASSVFHYPSGENGVIIDEKDTNLARQNPNDYLLGIEATIVDSIAKAKKNYKKFNSNNVIGIGVATTGSSPMPIDKNGQPLCFDKRFKDNLSAYVWLWKDHTSYNEANLITKIANKTRQHYIVKVGGTYSSEWWWSKILHCKNVDEEVFNSAYSWVEICDWIPAALVGELSPNKIKRSICAAGHKAMFNSDWGGLPDEEFLEYISYGLSNLRNRLYSEAYSAEHKIGNLSEVWSKKLGLSTNVSISVGSFDAHMGAVGAGIKTGTLVKILGTSTCDIMISPNTSVLNDIPGVCGIVDGSVKKGFFGIEAGQSAVGDVFLWFVNNLVPINYGKTLEEKFFNLEQESAKLKPGESGLLALDWNNGNRTILVDVRLSGLLLGQTLYTKPHEIYRALIEATAFGALEIINRMEEYGVKIDEIINCGGLALKSPLLMQIYADISNRPMKISRSSQTPALGAAIFSSVTAGENAGGHCSIEEAQNAMIANGKEYLPNSENVIVYKKLYALYKQLHDAFGTTKWQGNLFNVMKSLLNIRDQVRGKNA